MNPIDSNPDMSAAKLKVLVVLLAVVLLSPALVIAVALIGAGVGPVSSGSAAAEASDEAPESPQPEAPAVAMGPGATLYATCTACHGAEGGGNAALESPAIAGQSEWYLVRQLQAFRRGWRGASGDDDHGVAMAAAAKSLPDDAAVATVAAYVADLPPVAATDPVAGTADPVAGEAHYATCATCHGPEAEGMEQFGAPRLTHQHGWYLVHQLEEYREDGRGTHPDDSYGQMMAPMADTLPDDQAVRDVSAYIRSLTSP